MRTTWFACGAFGCLLTTVPGAAPRAIDQSVRMQTLRESHTLRAVLQRTGFSDAIAVEAARPDLDRPITSWEFATSADSFVAAYYFIDELSGGGGLGPLHISRFDAPAHRWIQTPDPGEGVGGSVLGIELAGPYVLVDLHW